MTWNEYNQLFHEAELNLVAFKPLIECDKEVMRMVELAVAKALANVGVKEI